MSRRNPNDERLPGRGPAIPMRPTDSAEWMSMEPQGYEDGPLFSAADLPPGEVEVGPGVSESVLDSLLTEAFDAGKHPRGFAGRWVRVGLAKLRVPDHPSSYGDVPTHPKDLAPASKPRPELAARTPEHRVPLRPERYKRSDEIKYEGGVKRQIRKQLEAHAREPQIPLKQLEEHGTEVVGRGPWTKDAPRIARELAAGKYGMDPFASLRAYTLPDGTIAPERQELYERIVHVLTQGKGMHEGNPVAHFTAGGPASGKTQLIKQGVVKMPDDVVHANPDVVKSMLPEYQLMLAAGRQEDAAMLLHEESSRITKTLVRLAQGHQLNILVDTVGGSERGKFAQKVTNMQRAGYEVHVHYVHLPADEAWRRAQVREKVEGRVVKEGYLRQMHKESAQRFFDIVKLPGIHLTVHDNQEGKLRLVAEKPMGADKLDIKDQGLLNGVLRKAGGRGD